MTTRILSWNQAAAIGLVLLVSACQAPPSHVAANPPPPIPGGPGTVWYTVHFDNDSFAIPTSSQPTVNDAVGYLRQHPNAVATIIGKTDTVGTPDYNMHLSHQRADSVRDALVYGNHIPADHVETRWTGEARQDHSTGNDVAASGNRVVDIAIHN